MKAHHLPIPAQHAIYWAFRGALTPPMLADVPTVLRTSRAIGRSLSRSRIGRRHLIRSMRHLRVAYPAWSDRQRRRVAEQAWEHLALLAGETLIMPRLLNLDAWTRHIELREPEAVVTRLLSDRPLILVTGHCGNWEVMGYTLGLLGFPVHAVYRPLDLRPLDRWVRETRQRRGLNLVDKFGAVRQLPDIIQRGGRIAFVADQNGGDRGVFVPFFGRLASTYKSIALLAMQTRATLVVGQAARVHATDRPAGDRARFFDEHDGFCFRVEVEDIIEPGDYLEQPDPMFYLSARYRLGIERMIRRRPGDYFWMHRSWRSRPRHERDDKPFPESLKRKLRELPWMDDEQVEALIERSDRDRAILRSRGTTRLP